HGPGELFELCDWRNRQFKSDFGLNGCVPPNRDQRAPNTYVNGGRKIHERFAALIHAPNEKGHTHWYAIPSALLCPRCHLISSSSTFEPIRRHHFGPRLILCFT